MKTARMLLVLAAACGGTGKPGSTATATQGPSETARMEDMGQKHQMDSTGRMGRGGREMPEHEGEGEMGEHGAMPPQLAKFHDTLAPRWHAAHGPQRMADTCAAMPQFQTDASAISTSQPPGGRDAAAWSTGGKQLGEAVAALDATCKANDAAAFEPAFERVHRAFHGLMEAPAP